MLKKCCLSALLSFLCFMTIAVQAQVKTNTAILSQASRDFRASENDNYAKALILAKQKGWPLVITGRNNKIATLVGVDVFGFPKYYVAYNNTIAAATTRANQLWPGGSSGLNLSGSSANMKNKIGEWDAGSPLTTHVELTGRINYKDAVNPGAVDHSTHVAGTMIATGVNPIAKGMAFGAQGLICYEYNGDISEMFGEANNLLLSNHSYGILAGWNFNSTQNRWEWYGKPGDAQDYKFGYYSVDAQSLDSIAYNAPNYLIVKAAGNNRNENGPAVGQTYWGYSSSSPNTLVNLGARPATISSNNGYDIISWDANAKNILTIGAVNGIPAGYSSSSDVVMSSFSSWGPTDDGRIKPDLVADGVGVTSCVATSNTAYATFDGTSMATPNTTGSLFLLQEYYSQLKSGSFMRSATLKGLAIHTADEAGPSPGPDYQFGWGLLDVLQASKVLTAAVVSNNGPASNHLVYESTLNNGVTATYNVVASGNGPLLATICWTDVKGTVETTNVLNNPTKKLVNDLDLRITKTSNGTVYMPWILDPANPGNAATRGDNSTDNVERVNVDTVQPGQAYTITITNKGALARGSQAYSLIVSGVGGTAICTTSGATNSGGANISNVTLGSFTNTPTASCTAPKYNNYTNLVAAIQPSQSIPLSVKVGSCDVDNPKIVTVYIDYNNNGVFTDAGEMVAQSGTLGNGSVFSTTIVTPATLVPGNTSVMRVIVEETSLPTSVAPCGPYATGETEDYLVKVGTPSNDIAYIGLVSPLASGCANPAQLVTVSVQNKGTVDKTNVTLQAVVKNGASTVATLTAIYPGTISAGSVVNYTFQTPFATTESTTYTITGTVTSASDQNRANDTATSTIVINAKPTAPNGTATVCNGAVVLNVTSPDPSANYFWWDTPTDSVSLASGSSTASNTLTGNNTYYVSSGARGSVGLKSKNLNSGGTYEATNGFNYITYSSQVPLTLESVRLFTKYPGTITINAVDLSNITSTSFSYSILATQAINVYSTNANPLPGNQTAGAGDVADTGDVFFVNMPLPVGSHAIMVIASNGATIFRNNNVTTNTYPYTLPNMISITGTQAGTNQYYNYLYDMKVKTSDCLSDRTAVVATVGPTAPVITQVGDSLVSNIATGIQWYLNGAIITGATSQKYKPVQSGNYQAGITAGSCTSYSNTLNVTATATVDVNGVAIGLTVAPNPSSGVFNVSFAVTTRDDLKIDVMNMVGQTIYSQTYPGFIGTFNNSLNIGTVAAGVYILRIQHHNTWYLKKLLIK